MAGGHHGACTGLREDDGELAVLSKRLDEARHGRSVLVARPKRIAKTALLRAASTKARGCGAQRVSFNDDELMAMSSSVTSRFVRYVSSSRVHCTEPRVVRGTSGYRVPRGCPGSCCPTMRWTSSSGSPPVDTCAFLHSLFWLFVNLAERTPVILAIDECHWIDGESLRWLRFLGGHLSQVSPAVSHPPCPRLPQPRSADRRGRLHLWRPLTPFPRQSWKPTHRNVRRADRMMRTRACTRRPRDQAIAV